MVRDDSTFIRESIEDVQVTLVLGGLLTVFIVFLFLNSWRSTVITGLTLPISVIAAFIAMRMFGFTLNVLTLMGLSLAIGMLIDDAIVVRENIVRHMQQGQGSPRRRARRHGGDRPGRHGDDVHDHRGVHPGGVHGRHGRPVLLRVRHHRRRGRARVAVRQLHARPDAVVALVRPGRRRASRSAGSSAACCRRFNRRFDSLHGSYERTLDWSLRHRWVVSAVAIVAFVSAFPILAMLGGDFMPDFNRGEYQVSFKATPGATLRETGDRAQQMVAKLRELPDVEYTYTTIGEAGSQYRPVTEGADLREAEAALGRHVQRGAARRRARRSSRCPG